MKISLLFLLTVFIFSACEGLNGRVSVFKDFSINYKDKVSQVLVGDYTAELKNKKNKVTIVLKNYDMNGDRELKILLPEGKTLPEDNGSFDFTRDDLGQSFDVHGDVATTSERDSTRHEYRSCNYMDREYHCYIDASRHYGCYWRDVLRYGHQEVWFHQVIVQKNVNVDFVDSDVIIAGFDSFTTKRYEVIENATLCR